MGASERKSDQISRASASSLPGSVEDATTTASRPVENFYDSMDVDESKDGPNKDGRSGRLHKGGRKLVSLYFLRNDIC
jgi:hypothetical protein